MFPDQSKHKKDDALSSPEDLEFRITWIDQVDGEPATTFANISFYYQEEMIWPTRKDSPNGEALQWYADQFLSFLARNWLRLTLEGSYPIDVQPSSPSKVWEVARKRWKNQPPEIVLAEENSLLIFEKTHNLASAFGGVFDLHGLWLMKSGDKIILDDGLKPRTLPYTTVINSLGQAGDLIAERLKTSGSTKWNKLIELWANRES